MKKLLILAIVISTIFIAGCKKEESQVTGQITYIGALTTIEYSAENASVSLHYGEIALDDTPLVVTADAEGNYVFSNLPEGNWQLSATVTINGFTYTGQSDIFYTTGKDIKTVNLILGN